MIPKLDAWNEWGEIMALEPERCILDMKREVASVQCNAGMLPTDVVGGATEYKLMKHKMQNQAAAGC
jgi:hypothetical protein